MYRRHPHQLTQRLSLNWRKRRAVSKVKRRESAVERRSQMTQLQQTTPRRVRGLKSKRRKRRRSVVKSSKLKGYPNHDLIHIN